MQIRVTIEGVDPMLGAGHFEVSARSENMIEAFKDFDNGKIQMRLKRENSKHSLKDRFHWIANFHYEHGIRPARIFEFDTVRDFAKKYITPYVKKSE